MSAVLQLADYAWIIDDDLIAEKGEATAIGIIGPCTAAPYRVKRLQQHSEGTSFRLYDADGVLYYTGRLLGDWHTESEGFAPLDDFGAPHAGCTRIDYFDSMTCKWVTL